MIRVLVVDDHPVVREGIAAVLDAEPDVNVGAQAASAEEVLRRRDLSGYQLAVIDVCLPGRSGLELCADLARAHPHLAVVLLTALPNHDLLLNAFTVGARGVLVKESHPAVLREAVRTVAVGGVYLDPRLAPRLVNRVRARGRRAVLPHGLTSQEMRVLGLLPAGMTNRRIGQALGIEECTVKSHVSHALRKLGAADRTEAAAIAVREGWA